MKPLLILSLLIAACGTKSKKPNEIWVRYNSTDTITPPRLNKKDTINIEKEPGSDSFHFEVNTKKKDTVIIKNKKQ